MRPAEQFLHVPAFIALKGLFQGDSLRTLFSLSFLLAALALGLLGCDLLDRGLLTRESLVWVDLLWGHVLELRNGAFLGGFGFLERLLS